MTTIDLIPTNPSDDLQEEANAAVPEPVEHQAEETSEHIQQKSLPEEATPVKEESVSVAQPKEKARRGRPPGTKNKAPRKAAVKLEPVPVEPLTPVKEENVEEPPPVEEPVISPRMQKRELMRQMAARRQEVRKAKISHYTNLLDQSLGY